MTQTVEEVLHQKVKYGIEARDFGAVALAYNRYGTYLELMGEEKPVGKTRFFSLTWKKWTPPQRVSKREALAKKRPAKKAAPKR